MKYIWNSVIQSLSFPLLILGWTSLNALVLVDHKKKGCLDSSER